MIYAYVQLWNSLMGDRRDGYGEEEEEVVGKRKLYDTGKTQQITMKDEAAVTTGYEGSNNTSSSVSKRGHPNHQRRTLV